MVFVLHRPVVANIARQGFRPDFPDIKAGDEVADFRFDLAGFRVDDKLPGGLVELPAGGQDDLAGSRAKRRGP